LTPIISPGVCVLSTLPATHFLMGCCVCVCASD